MGQKRPAAAPRVAGDKEGRVVYARIAKRLLDAQAQRGSALDHAESLIRNAAESSDVSEQALSTDTGFAADPDSLSYLGKGWKMRAVKAGIQVKEDATDIRDLVGDHVFFAAIEEKLGGKKARLRYAIKQVLDQPQSYEPQNVLDAFIAKRWMEVAKEEANTRRVMRDPKALKAGDDLVIFGRAFTVQKHTEFPGLFLTSEAMPVALPLEMLEAIPTDPAGTKAAPMHDALAALEAMEDKARERIAKRARPAGKNTAKGGRGGSAPIFQDAADVAIIAAARIAKAGVITIAKIKEIVGQVIGERAAHLRERAAGIEKMVTRLLRDSMGEDAIDPAKLTIASADLRKRAEAIDVKRGAAIEPAALDGPPAAPTTPITEPKAPRVGKPQEGISNTQAAAIETAAIVLRGLKTNTIKENAIGQAVRDAMRGIRPQLFEERYKVQMARVRDSARAMIEEAMRSGYSPETVRSVIKLAMENPKQLRLAYQGTLAEGVAKLKAKLPALRLALRKQIEAKEFKRSTVKQQLIKAIKETLPPVLRGKFLTMVKNVHTQGGLKKALERVQSELSKHTARSFISMTRETVTKTKMAELPSETGNNLRDQVQALADKAEALYAKLRAKGVTPASREQLLNDLKAAHFEIISIRHQNETEHLIKVGAEMKQVAEYRQAVIQALKKRTPLKRRFMQAMKRNPGVITRWIRWNLTPEQIAKIIDSNFTEGGVATELLIHSLWNGETATDGELRRFYEDMERLLIKAGFKGGLAQARVELSGQMGEASTMFLGADGSLILGSDKKNAGKIIRLGDDERLTLDQAMYLYAADTDTQLMENTRDYTFDEREFANGFRLSTGMRNKIEDALPERHKKFVRELKMLRDVQFRDRVFKVFREIKGHEPDAVGEPGEYMGRVVNSQQRAMQAEIAVAKQVTERHIEDVGYLKPRDENAKSPMLIRGFLGAIIGQAESSARIVHQAQRLRSVESVLRDPQVQAEMEKRLGAGIVRRVQQIIVDGAGLANPEPHWGGVVNRIIRGFIRGPSVALTALNARSWARNMIGGGSILSADLSAEMLAKGMWRLTNDWSGVSKRLFKHSDFTWARYAKSNHSLFSQQPDTALSEMHVLSDSFWKKLQRNTVEIGTLVERMKAAGRAGKMRDAKSAAKNLHAAVRDTLRFGMAADSFSLRLAWATLEAQVESEHADWSDAKKIAWVNERHERVIRRTQNGTSPLELSGAATTARHYPVLGMFTALSGDLQKKRSLAFEAWASNSWKRRTRVAASMAISAAMTSVLVTGGVGWLVSALTGGADDEWEKMARDEKFRQRAAWGFIEEMAGLGPAGAPKFLDVLEARLQRGTFPKGERVLTGPAASQAFELYSAGNDWMEWIERSTATEEKAARFKVPASEYFWRGSEKGGFAILNLLGVSASPTWWLWKGTRFDSGDEDTRAYDLKRDPLARHTTWHGQWLGIGE